MPNLSQFMGTRALTVSHYAATNSTQTWSESTWTTIQWNTIHTDRTGLSTGITSYQLQGIPAGSYCFDMSTFNGPVGGHASANAYIMFRLMSTSGSLMQWQGSNFNNTISQIGSPNVYKTNFSLNDTAAIWLDLYSVNSDSNNSRYLYSPGGGTGCNYFVSNLYKL